MNIFAPFSKVEEQDDGTIRLWGVASAEDRDSDGEITKADALRNAIGDYTRFGSGALREMHQPIAAGLVNEIAVGDDNVTRIGAHVVDPISVKKVRAGVFKGLSIGGKVTKRNPVDPREILACELIEISLVDRPACPSAVITLWKAKSMNKDATGEAFIADPPNMTGPVDATLVFSFASGKTSEARLGTIHVENGDPVETAELGQALEEIFAKRKFTAEERRAATESGAAMSGGRYPIENKEDLHNAIRAVGRGKGSHAAIRAHIKRRAKALGLESEIPEDWGKLAKNGGMDTVAHLANILSSIDCLLSRSEWEQEMEKDSESVQPAEIKKWLADGAELLKRVVQEEADELTETAAEESEGQFARVSQAIRWIDRLSKAPRVRHFPEVGEKIHFHSGNQHGGEPEEEMKGEIAHVGHNQVTVRGEGGHLQDFIWPHLEGHFHAESGTWMMKRGAKFSKEAVAHLQAAHDSLLKSGACKCAAADDEDLGKRVRALPPERREVVEAMLKSAVPPTAPAAPSTPAAPLEKSDTASAPAPIDFAKEMVLATSKIGDAMAAALAKAMEGVQKQMGALAAKVDAVASAPASAKGVTRLVSGSEVITKAADVAGPGATPSTPTTGDPVKDAFMKALGNGPDFTSVYDMLRPNDAA